MNRKVERGSLASNNKTWKLVIKMRESHFTCHIAIFHVFVFQYIRNVEKHYQSHFVNFISIKNVYFEIDV